MIVDEAVRCYSVPALAELWGCGTTFVYDLITAGELRTVQFGRGDRKKMRIRGTEAAAWLERNSSPPATVNPLSIVGTG